MNGNLCNYCNYNFLKYFITDLRWWNKHYLIKIKDPPNCINWPLVRERYKAGHRDIFLHLDKKILARVPQIRWYVSSTKSQLWKHVAGVSFSRSWHKLRLVAMLVLLTFSGTLGKYFMIMAAFIQKKRIFLSPNNPYLILLDLTYAIFSKQCCRSPYKPCACWRWLNNAIGNVRKVTKSLWKICWVPQKVSCGKKDPL